VNPEKNLSTVSRVRWQCRRGMLELDVLLNQFLDNDYERLSVEQKKVFDNILDYPDQVLYDLLLEKMNTADKAIAEIITMVRKAGF
jgi:antitoxin CptB